MITSEAKAERLVDATGPYVTRCGGMVVVENLRSEGFSTAKLASGIGHWRSNGWFSASDGTHPLDLVAKADVTTLIAACVRNLLRLHEETDPSETRLQHIAARLVKAYDEALQDLDEAGDVPLLDFEDEGDNTWSAPSLTMGDDGVAFRWRITMAEKPLGEFTLKHSESELVAPLATFPTFAMARARAERKDWIFGQLAKREEADDEADRELAARHASEENGGDEEDSARPEPQHSAEADGEASPDVTTCKVRVVAVSAEFDGADADLILPAIFEAFEGAFDAPTAD